MIVVANTYMLTKFKKLSIFKLDLGVSLIDQKTEKLDIKDPFMLKYYGLTGKQILSYGTIGKLKFYQDYTLQQREFYIFNKEIYGVEYTSTDEEVNIEVYLAELVKEINEKEGVKQPEEKKVDYDPKKPDIKLPKDQYIQEMIKKRMSEA